jgi:hypothetical protein
MVEKEKQMQNKQRAWGLLILSLCAFALQGCFGSSGPSTKTLGTNSSGNTVSVAQNAFSGKIYATIGHNLYVITGDGSSKKLVGGGNIYDPAVSPDGKTVVFVARAKDYSDLDEIPAGGGTVHTLLGGFGKYRYNSGGFLYSTYHWFFKPAWSHDGSKIVFLSDYGKNRKQCQAQNAYLLDLEVFMIAVNDPRHITAAAYAIFGGGGDSDPSFNPTDANQIVYTYYADITSDGSQQAVQVMLSDPRLVTEYPITYCQGTVNSGVAITNKKDQDIQPAYSPDGKSLAYVKDESATMDGIYIMSLPTGVTTTPLDATTQQKALTPYKKAVKLLENTYVSRPTWSPDGKQMAYLVEGNEELDMWVATLNYDATTGKYSVKGSPVQVTSGGIDGDSRFDWTP